VIKSQNDLEYYLMVLQFPQNRYKVGEHTVIKIHLSKLLGERRWTQADLARETGIRPSTIGDYYHELVERVNLNHLDKICDVLGCQVSDVLEYIPKKKSVTRKKPIKQIRKIF